MKPIVVTAILIGFLAAVVCYMLLFMDHPVP